jgi:DNA processing protein
MNPVPEEVRRARMMLTWLTEPGSWSVHRLVRALGPVEAARQLLADEVSDPRIRVTARARASAEDPHAVVDRAMRLTERLGARVVVPEDDEWPGQVDDLQRLARRDADRRVDQETAPPLCFWVRGQWPLASTLSRAVAVVGARAATGYGLHVASDLGAGLAEREWTVVSGGAFGIDAAAHRGALAVSGRTVAVLACGVDRPYPMGNSALFDRIVETGLLISEWPPGAEPYRHRFLTRNRVIAAVTAGTVLVEAAGRSGATQTARRALAIGRPTMAVPGPVTSAMSVGTHELLREHPEARLVTDVAQVIEEVGRIGVDLSPAVRGPRQPYDDLDEQAALLLDAVPARGSHPPDTLAARAGLDIRTTLRKLSMLEQLGLLTRQEGGYRLPPRRRGEPSDPTAGARGGAST